MMLVDQSGHTRHRSPSREHSSKLQYIFRDAKFFLIKSSNHENVALAQAKGVWSSPPPNEMRINQAFRVTRYCCVIVIFILTIKNFLTINRFPVFQPLMLKDVPEVCISVKYGEQLNILMFFFFFFFFYKKKKKKKKKKNFIWGKKKNKCKC